MVRISCGGSILAFQQELVRGQFCNTPKVTLIILVNLYKEQWIQWMKVVLKINGNGELQV
jgi:hypothetical protein